MADTFHALITPIASPGDGLARRVVQIASGSETNPVAALCSDSSIWVYNKSTETWSRIEDVPAA